MCFRQSGFLRCGRNSPTGPCDSNYPLIITLIGIDSVEMLALFIALFTILLCAYYAWVQKYPKGPFPLPFIGNLHSLAMASHPHKKIEEIGAPYGPIFTVFLPLPVIVITGIEETREALLGPKGENFASRPDNPSDSLFMNVPNGGIIFSEGKEWNEQRTFTLSALRSFGVGSQIMEAKILNSVDNLFEYLDKVDVSNIDINWPVHLCVGNIVHDILFGHSVAFEKAEKIKYYQDQIDGAMQMVRSRASVLIVQALPWTRHLPFIGTWGYWELRNIALELIKYIESQIEITKGSSYDANDSFVALYLSEMSRQNSSSSSFSYENMVNTVTDLWLAGMETAATTIRWAMTLLTAHPEVQDKLVEEMNAVIGDRTISMSDKPNLPYAQAVVAEIQRVANVVTFNVFHKTYKDDELAGIKIPAGATVLPQISAILDSDLYFKNAKNFDPERFINRSNGRIELRKDEMSKVIAFSLGKRQCAGEALARMEVFLVTLAIVQKYSLLPAEPGLMPELRSVFGILQTPKPYKWQLKKRR